MARPELERLEAAEPDTPSAVETAAALAKAIEALEAVSWRSVPGMPTEVAESFVERLRDALTRLDVAKSDPPALRKILHHHQVAVLGVVRDRGECAMGELYPAYCERVERPRTRRTVRKYLARLADLGLVEVHGSKRGRTYVPVQGVEGG